jgi:nickel-dependent lactate racemase
VFKRRIYERVARIIKKGHGTAWMKDWNKNMAFHGAEAEKWVKEMGFSFEKEW